MSQISEHLLRFQLLEYFPNDVVTEVLAVIAESMIWLTRTSSHNKFSQSNPVIFCCKQLSAPGAQTEEMFLVSGVCCRGNALLESDFLMIK